MKKISGLVAIVGINICTCAVAVDMNATWGSCTVREWDSFISKCNSSSSCSVIDKRPAFSVASCDLQKFCIVNGYNEPVTCVAYCEYIDNSDCNATINRQLSKNLSFSVSQCGGTESITYESCAQCTQTCSNCTSDASWSATNTAGIQQKVTRTCQCGYCAAVTQYQCASGYYGTATSASAGCTVCPAHATCAGGNYSTFKCTAGYYKHASDATSCSTCPGLNVGGLTVLGTSATGATSVTQCYIPDWEEICDDTGCFEFDEDCYYSK